jgi:hypothetical protein
MITATPLKFKGGVLCMLHIYMLGKLIDDYYYFVFALFHLHLIMVYIGCPSMWNLVVPFDFLNTFYITFI